MECAWQSGCCLAVAIARRYFRNRRILEIAMQMLGNIDCDFRDSAVGSCSKVANPFNLHRAKLQPALNIYEPVDILSEVLLGSAMVIPKVDLWERSFNCSILCGGVKLLRR